MAGYHIYSLDADLFHKFVTAPSQAQLLAFANCISEGLDEYDDEFEDDDRMADWPSEPEELVPLIKPLITRPDWYGELSEVERLLFEGCVQEFCSSDDSELGFRVESDGVYWDVIDIIRTHHNCPPDHITDAIISQFGLRPFRFHAPKHRLDGMARWFPYHSMHEPDEVKLLLAELQSAEADVMNSNDANAKDNYENELIPAVERVISDHRVLYISVDT